MTKTALVTGSSSGIGQAAASQLARRGFGVVVTYKSRASEAEALVAAIAREGGKAFALPLDVADVASLDGFVVRLRERLASTFDRASLDVLVNNAGVGGNMAFEAVTEAYLDGMFAANFKGPFFLTQKLLPLLGEGAHVVNVSSASARNITTSEFSVYGASKAALTAVTRFWAKELAPKGIRVNAVSPGPVRTNFADGAFDKYPEYIAPLAASTLLGRIAEPDDVGAAIAALVSSDLRFVTATDLEVSGGFLV